MKAQNRFWWILRTVRREISIASATNRGSGRIRVMPAACIATSVPLPIAKPTVAAASAGASLRPSPTMPTGPCSSSSRITRNLSSGNSSAWTSFSASPTSAATAQAAARLSPDSISGRMPIACNVAIACADCGRGASPNANSPSKRQPCPVCSASHDCVWPAFEASFASICAGDRSIPSSPIQRAWPSTQRASPRSPCTPRPATAVMPVMLAAAIPRACAASSTAFASGCSLPCCNPAASASSVASSPSNACNCISVGLPTVSVPVLSNATVRSWRVVSNASTSLTKMPARAATPVPAITAAGVASPSAHGHAITSTATALSNACDQSPAASPHANSVTLAMAITTGTNTALTLSTMRWIGAFLACASSTNRTMRASADSAPTATVRMRRRPSPFTAPPVTRSPGALGTGSDSPLSSDSSLWLRPSKICPSTGMRSPGSTMTSSSTLTSAIGTLVSTPLRNTRAVSGRNACRARMASVACRLARASSHLPNKINVMTTDEDSKYSGAVWCA